VGIPVHPNNSKEILIKIVDRILITLIMEDKTMRIIIILIVET